jgi:hypothetical protein
MTLAAKGKAQSARPKAKPKAKLAIDKSQNKEINELRKMVIGETGKQEDIYTVAEQQMPNKFQLTNLINYDNIINVTASNIKSRTVYRLNNKIYIRGHQDSTQYSALNTHRPIRVIYFMWKADVLPGALSGYNVTAPTVDDLFDDYSGTSVDLTLQRTSYKNRKRIKVLKDVCRSLTNHSGLENDFFVSYNTQSKYGDSYKYPTEDESGPAVMWLPYVAVIDPIVAASNRCSYAMKTHVLYTEANF